MRNILENVEIKKDWKGYNISKQNEHGKLYLISIYKNKANWGFDYAHGKHYTTRKKAEQIAEKIKAGIIE